jgi:hypothetical protein
VIIAGMRTAGPARPRREPPSGSRAPHEQARVLALRTTAARFHGEHADTPAAMLRAYARDHLRE